MGATLSACWFTPGWMYFAHIGDSRLYYLPAKEGELKQLSHDDTYVGWLYRKGEINERQAREHPRRTVLQRSARRGKPIRRAAGRRRGRLRSGRSLSCSAPDGLIDGLYDRHLAGALAFAGGPPRIWPAWQSASSTPPWKSEAGIIRRRWSSEVVHGRANAVPVSRGVGGSPGAAWQGSGIVRICPPCPPSCGLSFFTGPYRAEEATEGLPESWRPERA